MSIKGVDCWFTHVDFFLSGINKLGNGPSIDVFSFECSDDQVIEEPEGTVLPSGQVTEGFGKTYYNLQSRSWYRGPVWIYDVDRVVFNRGSEVEPQGTSGRDRLRQTASIEVQFTVRDAKTHVKLHNHNACWDLDLLTGLQPYYQDYQPREAAIWEFQRFQTNSKSDFNPLDVERFFKAFATAALHSTYVNNPDILKYRKPVNKNLLERLVTWLSKVPTISKSFDEKYDLKAEPMVIVDQRLDHPEKDPDAVGNIIVVLSLRKPDANGQTTHSFRW